MALSLQQVLKQTQRLIMTPQMQQSIQLLQLNSLELEQMIHQEMMENPFLELSDEEEDLRTENPEEQPDGAVEEPEPEASGLSEELKSIEPTTAAEEPVDRLEDDGHLAAADSATPATQEEPPTFEQNDVDWDGEYLESDTSAYSSTREDVEEYDFTTYTARAEGSYESLIRQLRLSSLEGRDVAIAEFVIGNLNESGFLDSTLENQAKLLGFPPELVDVKPAPDSEPRLKRMLIKMRNGEDREHIRELKRKQLIASIVAIYIGTTPDEAMAMSRSTWLRAMIAKKIGRPLRFVESLPLVDLVLEVIAFRLRTTPQAVFDVLEVIQEMEPTGIGARDLAECLRLQCEEKGIRNRVLYTILDDHLADLQQKRFREIAKALNCTEEEVTEVFHLVSHLDPRPGLTLTKESPRHIIPDVVVKKVDDKYMYYLNEGDAGRLRVASSYRRMLALKSARRQQAATNGTEVSVKDQEQASYVHEKYKNAVWLIKNIEKRKSTVLRVTEAIMNYQKNFLEKGIEHLHPLTLRNIAEVVGMHESTIARVTTQKYVETPRGIFELKFFFSSGLETDSGEDASSRSIKELITQMIQNEDDRRPLSDQKIADMLRDKGIQIARRTVAKYREQLKILPAKLRKEVS